jgi:adenosylcobinamide-phosphate synthase
MESYLILIVPLLAGYVLDLCFGDPQGLPHPVRFFGTLISLAEEWLNKGKGQLFKGGIMVLVLGVGTYFFFLLCGNFLLQFSLPVYLVFSSVFVYYALANKGLVTEGRKVFDALARQGLEAGQARLAWIVGRDTATLDALQIRKAVFETMSENLSDGVIAPLFYYLIAGIPGMMTYKMINTLDSMVGYRNARYEQFGKCAALLDDVVNLIPARLTALLMVIISCSSRGLTFIWRYGHRHKSPNSGYPEAALAGIIDVQFGGPNYYHGTLVDKPYIGEHNREIKHEEFKQVSRINHRTCLLMVLIMAVIFYFCHQ